MKLRNLNGLVAAAAVVLSVTGVAAGGERDVSLAGDGWRFAKDQSCELSAEAVDFNDSAWEQVRVPHDWAISGPFDVSAPGGSGKLPWKGVGWYRRTFKLEPGDVGASVFLDFDGVMASPEVYVNGQKAGGWDYGYASFRVDATPYVKPGVNTLAVRADTRDHRSRWYPGAGIYRKVVMKVRNPAHFAYNGIFVTTPQVSKEAAMVRISWELEGSVPNDALVGVTIRGPGKGSVPQKWGSFKALGGGMYGRVENPALWDVDAPNLYEVELTLWNENNEQLLSRERVRFGIRTIAFPVPLEGPATNDWAANGFHLNGRRVQFKGVDLHSDLGLLGMAFDTSAMRRQLQIMKDMGANALRTSHNCPAPEVLDLCDEMGILVWDEAFDKWDGTAGRRPDQNLEEYVARNLRQFVRRDRNHPCVVIWSMSNEIVTPDYKGKNYVDGLTKARCTYFREQMRLEDATRPVGNGNICWMSEPKYLGQNMFDDLDITGWNYGGCYRRVKAKYPAKPIVYSESASAVSSYGFYPERLPKEKHDFARDMLQTDGYDFNAMPDIADWEFDRMEKDVYCCGEFVWTGIDYLGEPTPYWKESRSSYFGIVDLMGVPKDRYWLYRSYWNPEAYTLHIVPHWTWPGREGKKVPVFVYTNGDSAELFVNGKSMGRRKKGEMPEGEGRPSKYYDVCAKYRLMWFAVPYEPGELKAVAYKDGKCIGEASVCTAGKPAALVASVEPKLSASPDELQWVQVDVVDADGVRNPLAMDRVSFKLSGPGKILGVGNGNAHEFEAFTKTDSHPLFYGKAVAVIRRDGPGELKLTVSAPGLASATAELH